MANHRPLVLYGREFDAFDQALTRQLAALPGRAAEHRLIEISALEELAMHGDAVIDGNIDVLMLNTDWLPSMIASERVLPLDSFLADMPPRGWPDAWLPSLRDLQTGPDGAIYGIAYHDGPIMLIYRSDLYQDPVEQAGFSERFGYELAPATTWEQYLDQAQWFDRPEHGLRGTVMAGFPDQHNNIYDFLTQLWSRGGDLFTADGRSGLSSAAAREAIGFLHELWHVHRVMDPAAAQWDSVASGVHFAAGEAALMVNWCGFAALSADPHSPTHGRVGCAPTPAATGPRGTSASMNSYWVLTIAAGCRQSADAYQLLHRLAEPDLDLVTAECGGTATRLDSWNRPDVRRLAPYYERLEEAHRSARAIPRDPNWPTIAAILDEMMALVVGGGDATAALAQAHGKLEHLERSRST